jgi:hypothetical protein
MKNQNILILLSLCIFFSSCDTTKGFLEDLNDAPQINFMTNAQAVVLNDSIKVGLKSLKSYYTIDLKVTDRNKNIKEVVYNQLIGIGKLKQDGIDIISNNISFKPDVSALQFDYYPENYGLHEIGLTVRDNFGLSNDVTVKVTSFKNLKPVAKFRWSKVGSRDPLEYKIIAEESFDKDEKYGGKILDYEFKVQGVIIPILPSTQEHITVIFPEVNTYRVELRVRDNDGEWSELYWEDVKVN